MALSTIQLIIPSGLLAPGMEHMRGRLDVFGLKKKCIEKGYATSNLHSESIR